MLNILGLVVMSLLMCGAANATLIGDEVSIGHYHPDTDTGYNIENHTVGNGVEYSPSKSAYSVDVGENWITVTFLQDITFTSPGNFTGPMVKDLNDSTGGKIISIIDIASIEFERSFGDNWIGFNFADSGYVKAGSYATIEIELASVPEPATLILLGLGLAGLGFTRRKQAKV
ncbi:MAG: PEP-CTERM sorting domain-containing protein [Psychromonas sp.]|nr:PEP-CTERM sorting domain-containing protein [Psychromonas sp.]